MFALLNHNRLWHF